MTADNISPKKPTIGMFVNHVWSGYQGQIINASCETARRRNVNLIVFPGKQLNAPDEIDRQQTTIYQLARENALDGIVMDTGMLSSYTSHEELCAFIEIFSHMPIVSLGLEIKGIPSVIFDNKQGMKEIVRHMIMKHNYRRIAFIKGLERHQDAELRFDAYREVLEEHQIPFDADLVVQGNFLISSGYQAVKELIETRRVPFDALISANDDMIKGIYQYLAEQRMHVPEQFAVGGFDNADFSRHLVPSVTTVDTQLYEISRVATEILIGILYGKEAPLLTCLTPKLIVRESCACHKMSPFQNEQEETAQTEPDERNPEKSPCNAVGDFIEQAQYSIEHGEFDSRIIPELKQIASLLSSDICRKHGKNHLVSYLKKRLHTEVTDDNVLYWRHILDNFQLIANSMTFGPSLRQEMQMFLDRGKLLVYEAAEKHYFNEKNISETNLWNLRFMIQNLSLVFEFDRFIDVLVSQILQLGFQNFFLSLYQDDESDEDNTAAGIPEFSTLALALQHGERQPLDPAPYKSIDILPENFLCAKKRFSYIVCPLFVENSHFGYITLDMVPEKRVIYEILLMELSNVLKSIQLFEAEKRAEKKLRTLSHRDELSTLYNRRGFFQQAHTYFESAKPDKKPFILAYADVDGLKKINDSFGHQAGDTIIQAAAEVLTDTFRHKDLIGRIGGDEFAVLAKDADAGLIPKFQERMTMHIQQYNQRRQQPFVLSISLGFLCVDCGNYDKTFDQLMNEADKRLYLNKEARRKP